MKLFYRLAIVPAILFLVLSCFTAQTQAADGDLDPAFGTAGKSTTTFTNGFAWGTNTVLQPDGKILVSGSAATDVGYPIFGVARHNPDGTIDPTFGTNGRVTVDLFTYYRLKVDVALQPDGKIILAGGVGDYGIQPDFGVVRLNPNGSLDATFGSGGKFTCDFFGWTDG